MRHTAIKRKKSTEGGKGGQQSNEIKESGIQTQEVVVVVVFTLTDRASTIPSNIRGCQSGTWSQRGTKVNGSRHSGRVLYAPVQNRHNTGKSEAVVAYNTDQSLGSLGCF